LGSWIEGQAEGRTYTLMTRNGKKDAIANLFLRTGALTHPALEDI